MARRDYEEDEDERPRRSKLDDEDEDQPRKRKASRSDDDDDEPVKNKKRVVDDDDDEDKPKKREYVKRDASDIKRHADQSTGSFDKIVDDKFTMFTPKEGTNVIRFLPSTYGDKKQYVFEFFSHSGIGADTATYVCPNKMLNKPCPICEERSRTKDEEVSKALRVSKRYLAWIVNRDAERDGPILWNLSPTIDKEVSSLCLDRHGRVILIDDPDEGYDVEFKREGTKLNTRYLGWKIERDPSPISDNEKKQDKWYDFIEENPLDQLLIIHDYEYLAKVFAGQKEKKDELDDDDDDAPRSSRSRRSSSRSMREELDDEIPERGAKKKSRDADDDDDDEKPKRKRERMSRDEDDDDEEPVKKKRKPVDEDEDDDPPPRRKKPVEDDDEGEDEDEKPRKKKKPVEDDDDDEEDVSERTKSRLKEMGARRSKR